MSKDILASTVWRETNKGTAYSTMPQPVMPHEEAMGLTGRNVST